MKKSHKWEEYACVEARCPHCRYWVTQEGHFKKGDSVHCHSCDGEFELGLQK